MKIVLVPSVRGVDDFVIEEIVIFVFFFVQAKAGQAALLFFFD